MRPSMPPRSTSASTARPRRTTRRSSATNLIFRGRSFSLCVGRCFFLADSTSLLSVSAMRSCFVLQGLHRGLVCSTVVAAPGCYRARQAKNSGLVRHTLSRSRSSVRLSDLRLRIQSSTLASSAQQVAVDPRPSRVTTSYQTFAETSVTPPSEDGPRRQRLFDKTFQIFKLIRPIKHQVR